MEGQRHQIKKAAEELGAKMKSQDKPLSKEFGEMDVSVVSGMTDKLKEVASKYAKEATSAKEAMGLTDAMVEGIYGQAYRLYNTGKYKEAGQLFRLLMMLDPKEPKYLLGSAACLHMMKEFKNAVEMYILCGVIDPESPIPHYHASDCYMQMKDRVSAIIALEMAITRSEGKPAYQTLKDRALLTIDNLKKELMPKEL